MKGTFPIGKFREMETPFYYYDANLNGNSILLL